MEANTTFSFQSLRVVYGCLSVAPLYVFGTIPLNFLKSEEIIYELFPLIFFWTLTIVSLLKYALIIVRADNNVEGIGINIPLDFDVIIQHTLAGGTFALYPLLCRHAKVGLLPNDRSANKVASYDVGSPFRMQVKSRARRAIEKHQSKHYLMLFLALFGSCMMIGDGVLPAISVLSASTALQQSVSDMSDIRKS